MKNTLLLSILVFLFFQCTDEGRVGCPDSPELSKEYTNEPSVAHCVMLVMEEEDNRMRLIDRRMEVIVFNEKNGFSKLKANNGSTLEGRFTIAVSGFKNLDKANDYLEVWKAKHFLEKDEKVLPFSQDNYRRFLKNKNLEEYEAFYSSMK